jgi:hypothetical protein
LPLRSSVGLGVLAELMVQQVEEIVGPSNLD